MPGGWQMGLKPKPDNLKDMLIDSMVPEYIRQTYLVGVNLGVAWQGMPGDIAMQNILNGIIADVQSKLGIRFERQVVKTDPDADMVQGEDFDLLGERLHHFRAQLTSTHYYIPLPYSNVVSVERVRLFYGNQLVYTVPADWIYFTSKEGILRLTPSLTNSVLQGNFGGFDSVFYTWTYRDCIPHAWSLDYTIGYDTIDADIARYIGLATAIQVLSTAGQGSDISGGLSNESLSQDGISESVGYAQGKYGPYSGLVQMYADELDRIDLKQKRLAKKGIKVAVV
jgi:hypothetical protein